MLSVSQYIGISLCFQQGIQLTGPFQVMEFIATSNMLLADEYLRNIASAMTALDHFGAQLAFLINPKIGKVNLFAVQ